MNRWRLRPLGGPVVAGTWLLLSGSTSVANLVFATLLALLLPWLIGGLWPEGLRIRRPLRALRLLTTLLGDILVANLQVAARILGPQSRLRPRFVWLPLELRNPYAISALASLITLTPGTLAADLTADRRWLLLHVLDVDDEAALVAQLKRRYERPLAEILP